LCFGTSFGLKILLNDRIKGRPDHHPCGRESETSGKGFRARSMGHVGFKKGARSIAHARRQSANCGMGDDLGIH